jgi:hypothetical protein
MKPTLIAFLGDGVLRRAVGPAFGLAWWCRLENLVEFLRDQIMSGFDLRT